MNAASLISEVEKCGGSLSVSGNALRYCLPNSVTSLLPAIREKKSRIISELRERELHSLFRVWRGQECSSGLLLMPLGELHVHFAEWLFGKGSGILCNRAAFERMLLEVEIPVVDGLACGIALPQPPKDRKDESRCRNRLEKVPGCFIMQSNEQYRPQYGRIKWATPDS